MTRLFVIAVAAAIVGGCASSGASPEVAGAALETWRSDLRFVAVAGTSEASVGSVVSVTAILTNQGPEPISACLRAPGQYTLWGTANLTQRLSIVDHRSCEEPLNLAPGAMKSWQFTVEVSSAVGSGPARIIALVDLLYPRCHALYGCYHISLKSEPAPITIVGTRPGGGA